MATKPTNPKTNSPKAQTPTKPVVKRRAKKAAPTAPKSTPPATPKAPAAPDLLAQNAALLQQIAALQAQVKAQPTAAPKAAPKKRTALGQYSTIASTLHGYVQAAQAQLAAQKGDLAPITDLKVALPTGADLTVQIVAVHNNTAMPHNWQVAHGGTAQLWLSVSTANMAVLQADLGIKPATPTKATHLVGCSFNNTTSSPMAKALSPMAKVHGYKVAIAGLTQQGTFKGARGSNTHLLIGFTTTNKAPTNVKQ